MEQLPPEQIAVWTPVLAVPLIAGIVQVAINSGMPVKHASLVSLLLGVVGGVASALSTDLLLFTGIIQGATMGLAAAGLWTNLSHRVNLNGE